MKDQLYYMQDKRQYVGNSMYWWARDGRGYCCHIKIAHVFTIKEAARMSHRETDILWKKEYIDSRIQHHIDVQSCDPKHIAAGTISTDKLVKGG